jgi:PIN domain nuclease of toxin-antitoxin system
MSVTVGHTGPLRTLPVHHRDPFDRLLVAQALVEGLTIVTHDPLIARYSAAICRG